METSTPTFYAGVLFYLITSKVCDVFTSNLFYEFKLESNYSNFTCPAEETLFHAKDVQDKVKCTLLCTKAPPCYGVFFRLTTRECVGCNTTVGLLPLDGVLFYRQVPSNVAKGKTTTTLSGRQALDGILSPCFFWECQWWVDLGSLYAVTLINIYTVNSFVYDDLRLAAGASLDSMSDVGAFDNNTLVFPYGSLETRYVEVRREPFQWLVLCELEVYGIPA
ncbi:uncharacterized protein LOC132715865 [Ruditapes philippinarum]|uniref:uncharacterized protein LOC132715865 n=1 Tax=Ruditapes philippinarum TaxID=129788 RepID=UPI00295B5AAE|nr:uncharacterized protein LOC132715865 [Ruditapes philippinarum]